MLIRGDNLLGLKALEQEFAGKVKCIYIDPPYNTGSAFEHYDDGLEHSIWLSLMRDRLQLLRNLLKEDGSIFVSIDNNEMAYLLVLMDEVFGRKNRKNIIVIKRGSVTGAKVINPGLVNISEFILVYTKNSDHWNPNRLSRRKERDERYGTFITNFEEDCRHWKFTPLMEAFSVGYGTKPSQTKKTLGEAYEGAIEKFVLENAQRVIQFASLDVKSVSKQAVSLKQLSEQNRGITYFMEREGKKPYFIYNGKLILFVKDRLQTIDGVLGFSEPLTDIWDDVLPNDLHNEGGVEFRKGKKPEKLIQRILELATNPGDLVLDSFLGSGTTAAVAHKMGRRWIGIELGEHCETHCLPRLKKVVDGEDPGGITKAVGWKGGGGFRYYRLAPSLLEKDKWDNWVVSKEYNAAMLAEAVCKLEGFSYEPSDSLYWQHGHSTERDFIYTTTANLSHDQLQELSDEVGPERSLLVVCSAFRGRKEGYPNLTVKKIPNAVLTRCEWGKDDYSLKVENLPKAPPPAGQQELF
ncbi:MAG: site-specific DNA-methyltransferase [Akkermansiaceae bacterium]|jgi:adenine-specific DNA-methyltransferase|nr:site-specific DNA-methyltransferase [Luteolibacter sp.]